MTHTDDYTVTIKQIQREKLPAVDDEFAKDLGQYQTLAELRDGIRKEIEKEAADHERGQALAKIFDKLIELNPIDAPNSLLAKTSIDLIMDDSYTTPAHGPQLDQVVQDTVGLRQHPARERGPAGQGRDDQQRHQRARGTQGGDADVDAEIAKMARIRPQTAGDPRAARGAEATGFVPAATDAATRATTSCWPTTP